VDTPNGTQEEKRDKNLLDPTFKNFRDIQVCTEAKKIA